MSVESKKIQMDIINHCKHYCVDKNLKQYKFAKLIGISEGHWSDICNLNKSISLKTIVIISNITGCDITFKFGKSNENQAKET